MGFPDTPVTDIEQIKSALEDLKVSQNAMSARLDGQANGINNIGQNQQWLVDNLQGIFQMFSNPAFMSQLVGMMTTGVKPDDGQQGPEDPAGPGGH